MSKPIKSTTRKLLFTMINKYKDVKSDLNPKSTVKIRQLNEIATLTDSVNGEELKLKINNIIDSLKSSVTNEMLTHEKKYLEKISSMTEVSVRTLHQIKKESLNEGNWNTPGKKRPHPLNVLNLDSFDISAIRNKINEFYIVKKQASTLQSLLNELKEVTTKISTGKRHIIINAGSDGRFCA